MNDQRDAEQDSRLQRIEQTFSRTDTPQGAAQRLLIRVPTEESAIALGTRGSRNTVGPPGIALTTTAAFAVRVGQHSILDGDGNVIFHSAGETRLLAEQDAAISSNTNLRIGTADSIEITAGQAGFTDPNYSGQASVPTPPVVDTATPRRPTEAESRSLAGVWGVLESLSSIQSAMGFRKGITSGVGAGSFVARVDALLGLVRSAESLFEGAYNALHAAAAAFEIPSDDEPHQPSLKVHGAGGVKITTPDGVSAYGGQKVSLSSAYKVSIKAGMSTSMKAGGNASMYGGASAQVKSEGVVGVKGRLVSVSGELAEMKAGRVAAVNGGDLVHVESDGRVSINAGQVAGIVSSETYVDARQLASVHGREKVQVVSEQEIDMRSGGMLRAAGDQGASLVCGDNGVSVSDSQVGLSVGSSHLVFDGRGFRLWGLDVQSGEIHLRRQIYLG